MMEQLEPERLRPAGSAGFTEQLTIEPPVEAGLRLEMATFLVAVSESGLKARAGAPSFTVSVKLAELEPPVFVPVIV